MRQMIRNSYKRIFRESLRISLMIIFLIFITVPFLWTAISSFKPNDRLMADIMPFSVKAFIPLPFTLNAYIFMFINEHFLRIIIFTIFICITTVLIGIAINSLAGFSFARFKFPGRNLLFALNLISFLVPFQAITVPLYMTIRMFGWNNTIMALIFPAVSNGLCIFLFRQFFLDIPSDLVYSAQIDGAGWFRIYSQIFMPVSKSAIITGSLLIFISQWQAFIWPLVSVQAEKLRMVQVAIAYFSSDEFILLWNRFLAAGFIIGLIPLFILYPLQKYYIGSMVTSGIKG